MKLFIVLLGVGLTAVSAQFFNSVDSNEDECMSEEIDSETEQLWNECSAEVDIAIFNGFDQTLQRGLVPSDLTNLRKKREADEDTPAYRRTLGCILQCIFKKQGVLGTDGIPAHQGLKSLITDGETNRLYYKARAKVLDHCYAHVHDFKQLATNTQVTPGQYCDMSYNLVMCFVDELDEFCDGIK